MDDGRFDAILLAGGRASRLGGVDKTGLVADGRSLLARSLEAAQDATARVVVGPRAPTALPSGVVTTRESPPFAGPVAAVAAGLAALDALDRAQPGRPPGPFVLVLACDLPRVAEAVAVLLATLSAVSAPSTSDGLVALDDDGRRQPLLALYRADALRKRLAEIDPVGASMRLLLSGLALAEVPVPGDLTADIDTAADALRHGFTGPAG